MNAIDVAVVGGPFVDITFGGLERLPDPGEELVADELHVSPGGTALQAIGAARLGLSAALVAPRPIDPLGRILGELLDAEGVPWIGPEAARSSVTAILPSGGAPAMASVLGDGEPSTADVATAAAGAVVASLGRASLVPAHARRYATTGSLELGAAGLEAAVAGARALVLNEREALRLTGAGDATGAARRLLGLGAESVVVTRGAIGAIGADGRTTVDAAAPGVDAIDATGAGDLFVAAYVWADLRGLDLEARVRWATLAAGLSVRTPTALSGAVRLVELLAEGGSRGLSPP